MKPADHNETSARQVGSSNEPHSSTSSRGPTTEGGEPYPLGQLPATAEGDLTRTQVIHLGGNVRSDRVVQTFDRRALELIQPGRRKVVLDLATVDAADTRIVAALVKALRRARSTQVLLELLISSHVRKWLSLYRAEKLFVLRASP